MKNHLEDIDRMIQETLTAEEAKFYNELGEQNVFEMLFGLFQGKNKWIFYVMNITMLFMTGLFVYCVIQFFTVETTPELIRWGGGCFSTLIGVTVLKLFTWMQMDKQAILRELKRLELQISSLSSKISE